MNMNYIILENDFNLIMAVGFIINLSLVLLLLIYFVYSIQNLRKLKLFRTFFSKFLTFIIFSKDLLVFLLFLIKKDLFQVYFLIFDFCLIIAIEISVKTQKKRISCNWWGFKPKRVRQKNKSLPIGAIIYKNYYFRKFFLNMEDIQRHILIYGQTGTGKTQFIMYFLSVFAKKWKNIPFTIFEFKGEYLSLVNHIENIKIYEPGINFSINIFDKDIFDSKNYAEILFDSLKSCRILELNADFSPQMERVLVEVLHEICQSSHAKTWDYFFLLLDKANHRYKSEIPQIATTIVSIKNRLRRFSSGPLSVVFNNSSSNIKISEIIEKRSIINLGSLLKIGGAKQDLIFFANLILKWIWESAMNRNPTEKLRHLTIFEDVSYIASTKLVNLSNVSLYLEDIALLLRGKGEGLISITTSLDISKNIILNAGTKMFFKFNEKQEEVLHYLSLDKEHVNHLQDLPTGMCIIKTFSYGKPFLLYSNNIKGLKRIKIRKPTSPKISKKPTIIQKNRETPIFELESEKKLTKKASEFLKIADLTKKIHKIENLLFKNNFHGAFFLISQFFEQASNGNLITEINFPGWSLIKGNLENLSKNIKYSKGKKEKIEYCLYGIKILKIIRKKIQNDKDNYTLGKVQCRAPILANIDNQINFNLYILDNKHDILKLFYTWGEKIPFTISPTLLESSELLLQHKFKILNRKQVNISFYHNLNRNKQKIELFFIMDYPESWDSSDIERIYYHHIFQLKNEIFNFKRRISSGFLQPFLEREENNLEFKVKSKKIFKNSRKIKEILKFFFQDLKRKIMTHYCQSTHLSISLRDVIENEIKPVINDLRRM